ncbi:hypothetical protein SAMN05421848_2654 [Kushneria avicenniae]|uniref:GntR family transcriptional regulator n=1 Tax=Kushneria avicenniae TaxID=402385 RepID=A0A1I1LZ40_9GAMM|nr:hypothetical protein [Kushneria avicenniae]SFC75603.1 hypothetical protein SAMN05421848_2654 [Kushneria avicenniae]
MNLEQLTLAQLARLERWLCRYPDIEGLEALLLERLESGRINGRCRLDSGRIARELDMAHALIRRAASSLETRGLIELADRRGAGPGLWLSLVDETVSSA